jgi:hypothetical protein
MNWHHHLPRRRKVYINTILKDLCHSIYTNGTSPSATTPKKLQKGRKEDPNGQDDLIQLLKLNTRVGQN